MTPGELSPLGMAAMVGDLAAARKALAAGRDPNERLGCGPTPLMMAIGPSIAEPRTPKNQQDARRRSKRQIVDLLMSKGADVKLADGNGLTALHGAASAYDSENIVKDLVARLLKAGAPADPPTDHGVTPLMMAVDRNRVDVARLLLAAGANPSAVSKSGDTPLADAERTGHTEMLTLLREAAKVRR